MLNSRRQFRFSLTFFLCWRLWRKSNYISMVDSPEELAKLSRFKQILQHSEILDGNSLDVGFLVESLSMNNLLKLNVRGSTCGFRLNDSHVIGLIESMIKCNIQLQDLSLSYHHITDVGFEEIGRLFQPGVFDHVVNNLESLDLEGNSICGSAFAASNLSSGFDCPLLCLNLSCNPLTSVGRMALAEIVFRNKVLRQLSISSGNFDLTSSVAFVTSLQNNCTLELLYFDRPLLIGTGTDEVLADHFGRVLMLTTSALTDVSLRYCGISNLGAKLLSSALSINKTMVTINLESNKIGDAGVEALASYFLQRKESSLKSIGLSTNCIGDDGAIALAEALRLNCSLKHISLKNNKIGFSGLSSLCEVLEVNNSLESISLFGNNFTNLNGKQFYSLINSRMTYTGLYLDIDVYIVDGEYLIAEN